ncbi:hypothetical protein C2R22_10165 [Salinigranum rubrum]|uniref:Small CPxCG-related zinc finger protein n=1 Tax=Salinigranum rubrum TaxID=755307 RepID=A0A2I8VJ62_9EURY|nr:hypothetical protein [Salinigranum rubrum]AUV81966.1 hypothetical protein C2R22_10165 [Salinigranum rubrum]
MATETIDCPECGATIESLDEMDAEEVPEIETRSRGGIGYGEATRNLYLCKSCRKPLGIGRRGNE